MSFHSTHKGGQGATGFKHGDRWVPAEGDTSIRHGWFWHEREDKDATFSPANLLDGNIDSYWTVDDGSTDPSVEITFTSPVEFNMVRLREEIRLGQRVEQFSLDGWIDGAWSEIHKGQTIGVQRLARLDRPCRTDRLRLRITASPAVPCISELSLYRMPVSLAAPEINRGEAGRIVIVGAGSGSIHFTLDGTEPSESSTVFTEPIKLPQGGIVKARVIDGERLGTTTTKQFTMDKTKWKLITSTVGDAKRAIDDDPKTFWHTHVGGEQHPPQSFDVDMGEMIEVAAFTYLPRQDGTAHGMTDRYRFEVSVNGKDWSAVSTGEFSNIRANPIEQTIELEKPVRVRYFRFVGLHAVELQHVSAAEIGVVPNRERD